MPTAKSQALSLGLHAASAALLFLVASHSIQPPPPAMRRHFVTPLAPPPRLLARSAGQHAGGSNQSELPARRGAPPLVARITFIPPVTHPEPKLPSPATIALDVPPVEISSALIGDPLSKLADGGLGRNGPGGIGDKRGGSGIGDSDSGRPGLSSRRVHKFTPAVLIYKIEPEFSEEARKVKYSGVVVLAIEIDTSGRARGLRVIESPGLGLDQKAIEAVVQWRFRPGSEDGKPVVTSATVEVNFRLL